jgi:uncharacterized membrane protein YGL010W
VLRSYSYSYANTHQYGTYHTHPRNVAIHIMFVPILMFTMMLWASNVVLPVSVSFVPSEYLNLSTLTSIIYAIGYVLMEPIAGGLLLPFVIGQSLAGTYCVQHYPGANKWAGIIQAGSWIAQFIGHGVWEKKAPALVDNLVQALFLAPLFVWIEVLFKFGYRPELRKRMEAQVKIKRAELDARGKKGAEVKKEL